MPNATVTKYLDDEDFMIYLKNKKEINKKAGDLIKREVIKLKSLNIKGK